jgi:hypothetical protein
VDKNRAMGKKLTATVGIAAAVGLAALLGPCKLPEGKYRRVDPLRVVDYYLSQDPCFARPDDQDIQDHKGPCVLSPYHPLYDYVNIVFVYVPVPQEYIEGDHDHTRQEPYGPLQPDIPSP